MDNRLRYFRGTGLIFRSGFLFRNPVAVGALGLFPVVAAGTGLKNAAALSFLFLLISVPSELVLCAAGMLIPKWIRPAAVLFLSAVFYVPAALVLGRVMPGSIDRLGLAAALMTCNSVLYSRAEEYAFPQCSPTRRAAPQALRQSSALWPRSASSGSRAVSGDTARRGKASAWGWTFRSPVSSSSGSLPH